MPPIISLSAPLSPYTVTKGLAVRDLEAKLVRHAACTLAGIKPANLFTWRGAGFSATEIDAAIDELSARLAPFGIRISRMAKRETGTLLLAWRPKLAQKALDDDAAQRILAKGQFGTTDVQGVVGVLAQRIAQADAARAKRVAAGIEPREAPKPAPFTPCCATGEKGAHHHQPGHVCQCRVKAALAREEAEATQGEAEFPHEIGLVLGYPPADVEGFMENKGANFVACGGWKAYGNAQDALDTFRAMRRCTLEIVQMHAQGAPLEALADAQRGEADMFAMLRAAM